MSNLPVIQTQILGSEEAQVVDARELHEALCIGRDFTDWIKYQIESLGLIERVDFTTNLGKSTGGRPSAEYILNLDAATHVAMASRTERGHQVRTYFIEFRKKALKYLTSQEARLSQQERKIATLEKGMSLIERYKNSSDPFDRLICDEVRTTLSSKQLPEVVTARVYSLNDRARELGYSCSRHQASVIGKKVLPEYRKKYGKDPDKRQQYVDGAPRSVCHYTDEDASWIDPIIHSTMGH